ncbi:ATP-dependent RNA helicase SUPV3L1/SUV3, partial [Tremellales sp. Uapishka_1]
MVLRTATIVARLIRRPICRQCLARLSRPISTSLPAQRYGSAQDIQERQKKSMAKLSSVKDAASTKFVSRPARALTLPQLNHTIHDRIDEWSKSKRTTERLVAYGFTPKLIDGSVARWVDSIKHQLENDELASAWDYDSLLSASLDENLIPALESTFLRSFLASPFVPASLRPHISAILATTDLSRLPFEQPARALSRNFHLHIGPTNSGKTYNALKSLSRANRGAYAGPLRLLAHEVWERMNLGSVGDLNGQGRQCNLLTGEERRIVDPEAGLLSCTVEMLPCIQKEPFDVVVIDEIQMLGDTQRGGSWTAAVLNVMAKEVHLCGDETTVDLLTDLIARLGDTLTIHRYERLTPLEVAETSLESDFNNVEPGDCIVTFSRTNIFSVKKLVEAKAGKKCAVVYGALPPETRAEQAKDFNDENGRAEVLVASDAVGMGLNLKIRRMVFESLTKFNGKEEVPLSLTQIKQIAGRAGRFGQARVDVASTSADEIPIPGGIVTTLHEVDLPLLRSLLPL